MISVAGGIIAAVGALIASGIAAYSNRQATKSTNDANLKLAQQQNQWNVDQVNAQNEYNSPSNQVQRLVDAGLNPALLYGTTGGNVIAGNQSSVPQSSNLANQLAWNGWNPDMSSLGSLAENMLNEKKVQNDTQRVTNESAVVKSTLKVNESQIQEIGSRIGLNEATIRNLEEQNKQIQANTQQALANIKLLDAETAGQLIDNHWKEPQYEQALRESESRVFANRAEAAQAREMVKKLMLDEQLTEVNIKVRGEDLKIQKINGALLQYDATMIANYAAHNDVDGTDQWLTRYSEGVNAATRAEVDRRNAATGETNALTGKRNAATNERNAKTNERNARSNETNAAANLIRSIKP